MPFRRRALAYCRQHHLVGSDQNVRNSDLIRMIASHTKDAVGKATIDEFLSVQKVPAKSRKIKQPITEKTDARVPDREFFESREWKELRYKALVECGAVCQCCGARRQDGVALHVDHIKSRSKYPRLQFTLSNLQVLCEHCNIGKGAVDETDWR
jgi:5-methylcytosine-specific restriction endonuclease McrA